MRNTADAANIKWKQNALRHSWISYRLAEIQDVNRVALGAGNSPQMIFRDCRELATPEQGRTWFAQDFPIACDSLGCRLGITGRGAGALWLKFVRLAIIRQTAVYKPNLTAARYCWLLNFT
jgi:hypothetical protein